MNEIKELEREYMKQKVTKFNVGDTVKVHVRIKEGDKERVQVYEGTVIAKKGGGLMESFTVRKISYGVGVERVFHLHSPLIKKIEVKRSGDVRRAKLYYLRARLGKSQVVKERAAEKKEATTVVEEEPKASE